MTWSRVKKNTDDKSVFADFPDFSIVPWTKQGIFYLSLSRAIFPMSKLASIA